MSPLSRRRFAAALGGAVAAATVAPQLAKAAQDSSGGSAPAVKLASEERFLELYNKIKDSASGYFSPEGLPYHSIETLMVEAPDHGHQTTSEAISYWMWMEAVYGRITGDWGPFNDSWAATEQYIIPTSADQPTSGNYDPSAPATYIAEHPEVTSYPSPVEPDVPVGEDPIANELQSTYGTAEIYGMHWLLDLDNTYGFGCTPGSGGQNGPGQGPSFMNTYQRGSQESVWETVPQPTFDQFQAGGENGYLDLFVDDEAYAQQFKYTNAPDADARAVQAAYWALVWAKEQGNEGQIADSVSKAAKMGDYLRYAMFDKYFKQIGDCTDAQSCPAGQGRSSQHYTMSWYYAWGGADDGSWAWRIGDGASHQGYQNVLAAWALSEVSELVPQSSTGQQDWSTSLTRQLEFLRWLQSSEGGFAGGATNSWLGSYSEPPSDLPTFYGMFYDWQPVWNDPPSNNWFGFQVWGTERIAAYYYATGDENAKALLDKWIPWASGETTVSGTDFRIPATLEWSGNPDTWDPDNPGDNAGLHVSVLDHNQDVGIAAGLAKTLMYYAAGSGDTASQELAASLLEAMSSHADDVGIATEETRADYDRFGDEVYIPDGWSGTMPNGDPIEPGSTFASIRSFYQDDPDWPKVQAYLDGGEAPTFTYHRFWAQAAIAIAFGVYAELFEA